MLSCNNTKEQPREELPQEGQLTATLELEIKTILGEGALWNHRTGELLFIDIEGKKFYKYWPTSDELFSFDTPSRVGTVVPKNDSIAVLALEDGIYEMNIINNELSLLAAIEADIPTNRFNDGKCDPNGNLWVGSMRMDESEPAAFLYKVRPDGIFEKMLDSITISNGIVWTRDQKTMYYIDTPTSTIRAFDYDNETATISNERVAVKVSPEDGYPDGMTIDENDMLWVGMWNGNAVACYNPKTGELVKKIQVPAHNVTSCAFGGPDLDILYITTASVDMTDSEKAAYPLAGSIFSVKPGVKGVKNSFFGQ